MAKALRDAKAKAPKIVGKTPAGGTAENASETGPVTGNKGGASVAGNVDSGKADPLTSTNEPPESVDQGGAGNGAGSAGSLTLEDLDKRIGTAEDEFRAKFPHLAAAMDAWQAISDQAPDGVRIASKVEGFRRAGIRHSKQAIEHLIEDFKGPEQLEALFAEPNLIVELI